jgi:hypothetical protein
MTTVITTSVTTATTVMATTSVTTATTVMATTSVAASNPTRRTLMKTEMFRTNK